jgi:hypothetical protein
MIDCPAGCADVVMRGANRSLTPARPAGDEQLPAGVAGRAKNRLSVALSRSRPLSGCTISHRTERQATAGGESKVLAAKANSDDLRHDRFGCAWAETAAGRPRSHGVPAAIESKHKHRCKVCRTRDEQPISEGE